MRTILSLLLCLFATTVWANPYLTLMSGSVTASACGQTDAPGSGSTTTAAIGYANDNVYRAGNFQAAGAGTYSIKTLYVRITKVGSPGDLDVRLCTDDGEPDSCTDADADIDADDVTSSPDYTWAKVNFTAGYSLTNGTTYWVRLKIPAQSTTNYYNISYYTSGDNDFLYSADGSSWTNADSSSQLRLTATTCLE